MTESIYNLLPVMVEQRKSTIASSATGSQHSLKKDFGLPSYSSFPDPKKPVDGTNNRKFQRQCAVIGQNIGDMIAPSSFLRKNHGVQRIVSPVIHKKIYRKGPTTLCSEKPLIIRNAIDFQRKNIHDLDHIKHQHEDFMSSENFHNEFGRIPSYLLYRKDEISREKHMMDALKSAEMAKSESLQHEKVRKLSEDDRVELLSNLKQQWKEKTQSFLSLPLSNSSNMNNNRREKLEKRLRDIEKLIATLSSDNVFVFDKKLFPNESDRKDIYNIVNKTMNDKNQTHNSNRSV